MGVINKAILKLSLEIVEELRKLRRSVMAKLEEVLGEIDTATTTIGNNIAAEKAQVDAIVAQLKDGMSPAELQAAKDRLTQVSARLTANADAVTQIASDPNDVVPVEPPPAP